MVIPKPESTAEICALHRPPTFAKKRQQMAVKVRQGAGVSAFLEAAKNWHPTTHG
jgi:hypothetical protein